MNVGITGQSGFIGKHLYNFLNLQENIKLIPFKKEFFNDIELLQDFTLKCDVIVHLAAVNRHSDPKIIYDTNISLVEKLIAALEQAEAMPHILFSSSTQEDNNTPYGKSKQEGRKLFKEWAIRNGAKFTGFIVPNVFGPFGVPFYNSFIATFCHQLTHGKQPKIEIDGEVKLIYVGDLVKEIFSKIICNNGKKTNCEIHYVPHTTKIRVSEVLKHLKNFRDIYLQKGIIPNLDNEFEKDLFNTFLCYINHKTFFPFSLTNHSDERGSFVETIKLNSGGQISFSTTHPGVTRGNHYHTRKAERFAVIKGKAKIELRKIGTEETLSFILDGNKPSFVDMPIWHTHNITNIGETVLYTIFWINEHYIPENGDTYFEKV